MAQPKHRRARAIMSPQTPISPNCSPSPYQPKHPLALSSSKLAGSQPPNRENPMSGSQKVAAITGAAQGIGRHTAELLATRGYHIAILDLQRPTATIAAIEAVGGSAFALTGDITDESVVESFAHQTL